MIFTRKERDSYQFTCRLFESFFIFCELNYRRFAKIINNQLRCNSLILVNEIHKIFWVNHEGAG
jgi:hypothetical protein